MTVAELIAVLQTLDQKAKVLIEDTAGREPIENINSETNGLVILETEFV